MASVSNILAKNKRNAQPFEYHSVRSWSKEINKTLSGGRKKNSFLIPRPKNFSRSLQLHLLPCLDREGI